MPYIKQIGLSMVELMIAMTLSSFLILGVTQIYLDNSRSYTFQQSQAENQEGSRYSLLFLQQELAKSGYRRRPDEPFEAAFPADTISGCTFAAGETVKSASSSSICIRYQPKDHKERDCLGNIVDSNLTTPYTKTNSVVAERIWLDSTANTINCTRGSTSSSLVNGVADLRFEYGVGSAASPQTVASYTKTAVANSATQPVLSVRYTTLFRSSNANQREATTVSTALTNWQRAVAGAECNTVIELKLEHHAA